MVIGLLFVCVLHFPAAYKLYYKIFKKYFVFVLIASGLSNYWMTEWMANHKLKYISSILSVKVL